MMAAKRMYLWSKEYSAEVGRGIKSYNAANKKSSVWTRKLTDYEKNELFGGNPNYIKNIGKGIDGFEWRELIIVKKMVLLDSIDKVKEFVKATNSFMHDVTVQHTPHIVDGKSIMGVLSLNLSSPVSIEFDEEDEELAEMSISKFYVR